MIVTFSAIRGSIKYAEAMSVKGPRKVMNKGRGSFAIASLMINSAPGEVFGVLSSGNGWDAPRTASLSSDMFMSCRIV